jgi:hypothetical protein
MLHRIQNITNIDLYSITCIWNDGKERMIDFEKLMADYPEKLKGLILNPKTFKNIKYNQVTKSVYFPNIINGKDENDHEILGELDFCPDVLYQQSEIVK